MDQNAKSVQRATRLHTLWSFCINDRLSHGHWHLRCRVTAGKVFLWYWRIHWNRRNEKIFFVERVTHDTIFFNRSFTALWNMPKFSHTWARLTPKLGKKSAQQAEFRYPASHEMCAAGVGRWRQTDPHTGWLWGRLSRTSNWWPLESKKAQISILCDFPQRTTLFGENIFSIGFF